MIDTLQRTEAQAGISLVSSAAAEMAMSIFEPAPRALAIGHVLPVCVLLSFLMYMPIGRL